MQKSLFDDGGHDVPQGTSLGGQRGHVSIDMSLVPLMSPQPVQATYKRVQDRRAAFAAWEAAGSPWPPPAGLTSACLDAAMVRPGKPQPKWGKR